jgi:Predicted ATPase
MSSKLQKSFSEFCNKNKFEINKKQIEILNSLEKFIFPRNRLFNFFSKKKELSCFYLYGSVGVGKTMLANFLFEQIEFKKTKFHFNEFMINFHDFRHKKKDDNSIFKFVKNLKQKFDFVYLDEFQVTNIVDAMILGKLFENIFLNNIKILITTKY